jgi:putative tricarboxylic transport membrane protein
VTLQEVTRSRWETANKPYLAAAVILLIVACVVAAMSSRLAINTRLGPGPGFLPMGSAILLAFVSILMIREAVSGEPRPDPAVTEQAPSGVARAQMIGILVLLIVSSLTMEWLGFRLTMLGFYVLAMITLGERNPIVITLVALAGSVGVYHVMAVWLQVPLPIGVLGV